MKKAIENKNNRDVEVLLAKEIRATLGTKSWTVTGDGEAEAVKEGR